MALFGPLGAAASSTFYVDYADGSDSAAGTVSAPFKHCPGDANATGHAASTALAGDTVIFKGGVTYVGSITCAANDVTYDGNSAGTFGTGRAMLDGENSKTAIYGFIATGKSGLIFNDLEFEQYGGHGSTPWTGKETSSDFGYAIYLDECSNSKVSACYFQNLGDWQNVANASDQYMEGIGVEIIDSGTGITITGCDFTEIGRAGIMIDPRQGSQICSGISITGNNFHDYLRWGICLTTGNTDCTVNGITIDGNQFHDIYQYATGSWLGLAGDAPHVDGIIAYIGGSPPQGGQTLGTAANPVIIRNNSFYNNASATGVQNAGVFLDTWGGRTLIYNNTFVNTLFDGNGGVFCLEGTNTSINPAPDYWIANNSFYDSTYAVTLESDLYPLKNGDVHVLNNVFYKPDTGAGYSVRVMDTNSTPTQLDYNLYYTGRSDNLLTSLVSTLETLAQVRSSGFEQHGIQANPSYANVSYGLGSESSSNNLELQSGSSARGKGDNLASLFTADRNGSARPSSGAWDIGAYQYASGSSSSSGSSSGSSTSSGSSSSSSSGSSSSTSNSGSSGSSSTSTTGTTSSDTSSTSGGGSSSGSSSSSTSSGSASSSTLTARLSNLSARAYSASGANVILAGFVVSGASRTLLFRGIGPGLAQFGISGYLVDPVLSLYAGSKAVASNDGWGGTAALQQAFAETGAFSLSPSSKDDALLDTVSPGSYSVEVAGAANTSGVAMAEIYDTQSSGTGRLVNISARAQVHTGSDILIAGFAITGSGTEKLLIRAVGPSLASQGVSGALATPVLSLYSGSTLVQSNSGWGGGSTITAAAVQAGAFALTSDRDAAMVVTLPPGTYTAEVTSSNGSTGVALAEIYELP